MIAVRDHAISGQLVDYLTEGSMAELEQLGGNFPFVVQAEFVFYSRLQALAHLELAGFKPYIQMAETTGSATTFRTETTFYFYNQSQIETETGVL